MIQAAVRRSAPDFAGVPLVYHCAPWRLGPELTRKFIRLSRDSDTEAYIRAALGRRGGRIQRRVRAYLSRFFSWYDLSAWLDRDPLYLFSPSSARTILENAGIRTGAGARLLDVGAGHGTVTVILAEHFGRTIVTETSPPLAKRLRARGFPAHIGDLADSEFMFSESQFDLITLLNVLDRCPRPLSLLRRCRTLLAPQGALLVATPLPFRPGFSRLGGVRPPQESLQLSASPLIHFEQHLKALVARLGGEGWRATHVSRCPYISVGDDLAPLYLMDDAILVLRLAT